jgi:hypothetical protein
MRIILSVATLAGLILGNAAAATVHYEAIPLDTNVFQITYSVSNVTFLVNQELNIEFDPALYLALSDGVAPFGFDLLLLQPNNPPGAAGDFSALALVDHPAFSGEFSVVVVMAGGNRPGEQSFSINQLDENGVIVSNVSSGETVGSVPEPATLSLIGVALLAAGLVTSIRRRRTTRT